jgi:hypothetical protein
MTHQDECPAINDLTALLIEHGVVEGGTNGCSRRAFGRHSPGTKPAAEPETPRHEVPAGRLRTAVSIRSTDVREVNSLTGDAPCDAAGIAPEAVCPDR